MTMEGEQIRQWQNEARMGQAMSNLDNSPDFHVFKAEIIEVMKEQALKIFTDAPADDVVAIVGAQQRRKIVDWIENEMNTLVEQGRLASEYLNNSNTDDGGIA